MNSRKGGSYLGIGMLLVVFSICAAAFFTTFETGYTYASSHNSYSPYSESAAYFAAADEAADDRVIPARVIRPPRYRIEDDERARDEESDSYRPKLRKPKPEVLDDEDRANMTVTIGVTPGEVGQVFVGETVNFAASIRTSVPVLSAPRASWSVSGRIGDIDSNGIFTATDAGTGSVTAFYGGTSVSVPVSVNSATMSVEPGSLVLTVGESFDINETIETTLPVSSSPRADWGISGGIGTINSRGVFTATDAGDGTITASYGGATVTLPVTVNAAAGPTTWATVSPSNVTLYSGEMQQFTATFYDATNSTIANATPVWSVSPPAIGVISSGGRFSAMTAGTGTVTATYDGVSASANVTVLATGSLDHIVVRSDGVVLLVGEMQGFSVYGYDAAGHQRPIGAMPSWYVNGGMGNVSPSVGSSTTFTASSIGGGQVCASAFVLMGHNWHGDPIFKTFSDCTTVVVVSSWPIRVRGVVTPENISIYAGEMQQFTATFYDASNNTVPNATATWGVSPPILGVITSGGRFSAMQAGTGAITATYSGVTESTSVTVLATGSLDHIVVRSDGVVLLVGEMQGFGVYGYDAAGHERPVGAPPNWYVNGGIGNVSPSGGTTSTTFTATSAGGGQVCASLTLIMGYNWHGDPIFKTFSDCTDVGVVSSWPIRDVIVSPSPVYLNVGDTYTFTATVHDIRSNVVSTPVGFSVTGGVGTIMQALPQMAVFTATTPGTGNVVANAGVTGSANVTVYSSGALASIALVPSSADVYTGQTVRFEVFGYDAGGAPVSLSGTTQAWSNSNNSVGTLSASTGTSVNFTAAWPGSTNVCVMVSSNGTNFADCAPVTVSDQCPVRSITIAPASASLVVGQGLQFNATTYDANGNAISFTPNWTVGGGIGTVSNSGYFTATTAGSGSVTASACNLSANSTVAVAAYGAAAAIGIQPSSANIMLGDGMQFNAIVRDSYGNTVPNQPVNWSTSGGIGTINSTGYFQSTGSGLGSVRAQSGSLSGTATVYVSTPSGGGTGTGGTGGTTSASAGGTNYCAGKGWYCDSDTPCCAGAECKGGKCVAVEQCIFVGAACGGSKGTNCCSGTCTDGKCKAPVEESKLVTVDAPSEARVGEQVNIYVSDEDGKALSVEVEITTPQNRKFTVRTDGASGASYVPDIEGKYAYSVKDRIMASAAYTYVSPKACLLRGEECSSNSDCCAGNCASGKCASKVTELRERGQGGLDIGLAVSSFFGGLSGIPMMALIALGVLLAAGLTVIAINYMGEKKIDVDIDDIEEE